MPEPKPTVLLQLDADIHPSVFDAVVAVDSGVDHLLRHGGVRPEAVAGLVHGLLFTRGGDDLRRSAVFVGGSDVAAGEAIARAAADAFFGPFRVAVLVDPNGSSTTAAAAALAIGRSLGSPEDWGNIKVTIVGAGPVGGRVARLLMGLGAKVAVGSPDPGQVVAGAAMFRVEPGWESGQSRADVLVAAGPAGVEVLPTLDRAAFPDLKVAVDLNAVPPHGLGAVKPGDADRDRDGIRAWGALGVGGLKMKVHKAAIRALFDADPAVLDVEQVYQLGRQIATP